MPPPLPPFCLGALLPPLPPPLLSPLVATPAKEERQQGLVQQEVVEATRAVAAVFFASLARRNSLRESSSWARVKDGRTVALAMSSVVESKRESRPRRRLRTSWESEMGLPTC